MINKFYKKLANLAVNYSINVKKGDRVYVTGPTLAKELFQAMYIEIIKVRQKKSRPPITTTHNLPNAAVFVSTTVIKNTQNSLKSSCNKIA